MKENRLYTVAFTVLLCCICAFVVTFANARWHKLIVANENFDRILAIVETLGLWTGPADSRKEIIATYDSDVQVTERGELTVYEGRSEGRICGYALDVIGRGKYDLIKGILAIGPGTQKIKALKIYQQNETPGLGGKIQSKKWLSRFSGVPLVSKGVPGVIISSKERGPNVIDAITMASKTMHSIQRIVNKIIAQFLAGGMALEPLDLGLGLDAVTRATPGYPKNLKKPPHLREEVRRPDFMASTGLKNLVRGKPVTCSMEDEPIIGELEQITDGLKTSGQFDYVELDLGPQWVQVDLGRTCTLHAVVIWHYYKNPVIYNDVIVQVSDGAGFADNVHTLFNNDHDNSSNLGKGDDTAYFSRWWGEIVDARGRDKQGTPARYVRVYTNGGAGGEDTRFVEIAVYGK